MGRHPIPRVIYIVGGIAVGRGVLSLGGLGRQGYAGAAERGGVAVWFKGYEWRARVKVMVRGGALGVGGCDDLSLGPGYLWWGQLNVV